MNGCQEKFTYPARKRMLLATQELIRRASEWLKKLLPVRRHAINGDEYWFPTINWKAHHDLIKAAWTTYITLSSAGNRSGVHRHWSGGGAVLDRQPDNQRAEASGGKGSVSTRSRKSAGSRYTCWDAALTAHSLRDLHLDLRRLARAGI